MRALSCLVIAAAAAGAQRTDVAYEATIPHLQAEMAAGRLTSVQLVDAYLARITAYDTKGPALHAMIRVNPKARADAAARDAERRQGRVRGPLHGIPVILKDNYNTADMPTTAGSIALAGLVPPTDAFQVRKLRAAGAVIIGKSNMHELASGITTISSLGSQTCNPYDPDRYPGGSSGGSGAAVAASFAAIAYGSDTCGSIRIPAAYQNLYGLRPTKGLSSIDGIIPLSHTQDVAGPLARTVTDLAIGLDATIGRDSADAATRALDTITVRRFSEALDSTALRGARIGVLTSYFGTDSDDREVATIVQAALGRMRGRRAETIDITIPGLDSAVNGANVINYEFKYDLIDYLAKTPGAPVASLAEILDRGLYHAELGPPLRRREMQGTRDSEAYLAALRRREQVRALVVKYLDENHLDAIAYPTMRRKSSLIGEPQGGTTCSLSAVSGLPALSMPAGFTNDSLPVAVELIGRPFADWRLVALAYDYEQATQFRRPPSTTPPLVEGHAPAPLSMSVSSDQSGLRMHGQFLFDPTRRSLDYTVRITGAAPSHVYAVSLNRTGTDGKGGAMLYRLSGIGAVETTGTLKLGPSQRGDLLAGRVVLTVYTSDNPHGVVAGALVRSK